MDTNNEVNFEQNVRRSRIFMRFVSLEATGSVECIKKKNYGPKFNFDFVSVEFIIKLFQLVS